MSVVEFFNSNIGFMTIIVNAVLVIITAFYVYLTGKMSKASSKTVQQTNIEQQERKLKESQVKKNLIYLLNSELYMNSFMYVFGQYYLLNGKSINFSEKLRYLANGITSVEKTSKSHIVINTKNDTWKQINIQCSQYLSNELMQELVGYYAGVQQSKIYSLTGMSNDKFIEFCKGQLVSTFKCICLLKKEEPNLRIDEKYQVNNKILMVNEETGEIIEGNEYTETS